MKIERNWYLLLAVAMSAAVGAAIASKLRRRRQRMTAHLPERASELKSWENEGGNLAPIPATPVQAETIW
jgi:hypothetical protein